MFYVVISSLVFYFYFFLLDSYYGNLLNCILNSYSYTHTEWYFLLVAFRAKLYLIILWIIRLLLWYHIMYHHHVLVVLKLFRPKRYKIGISKGKLRSYCFGVQMIWFWWWSNGILTCQHNFYFVVFPRLRAIKRAIFFATSVFHWKIKNMAPNDHKFRVLFI